MFFFITLYNCAEMNKKTLIALCVTTVLLLGGIVAALLSLYGPAEKLADEPSQTVKLSRSEVADLLLAVPEDASLVMCGSSLSRLAEFVKDTTKVYDALLFDSQSEGVEGFVEVLGEEFPQLKGRRCVVSLHYGGNMVPLVVLEASRLHDTAALDSLCAAYSVISSLVQCDSREYLLCSSSESLVNSASRHLLEGGSIMDDEGFRSCLESLQGKDFLLWSGLQAGKLLATYAARPYQQYSSYVRRLTSWTALSVSENSGKKALLEGHILPPASDAGVMALLQGGRSASVQAAKVLPAGTVIAVDLPLPDAAGYYRRYLEYLDAGMKLSAHKDRAAALRSATGVKPEDWLSQTAPKEVVYAEWTDAQGRMAQAVFLRCGNSRRTGTDGEYMYKGYASLCFGEVFALQDESACARSGQWLVSGSKEAVEDALACIEAGDTVGEGFPEGQYSAVVYADLGHCALDSVLKQPLCGAVKRSLLGSATQRAVVTLNGDAVALSVVRSSTAVRRKDAAPAAPAFTIDIPKGPWEVTNSATGKKNKLYQNSHLSICLQDENGKDVWGVPFKDPICGCVEEIDYYANGKIQFLFAAGSRLYLMDRLSRTVKGFPVDLGKEVLLGPSVYDFTGAHGYTAVVLHKDNTLGMYNLHGVPPEQWKGIAPEEMITGLPELVKIKGASYWLVPSLQGGMLYPFYGGERVKDKKILNQLK